MRDNSSTGIRVLASNHSYVPDRLNRHASVTSDGQKIRPMATMIIGTQKAFLAICTALVVGCSPMPTYERASLCDIRKHPEQYDSKRVVIEVTIDGDHHGAVILDPNCPTTGALLKISETFHDENTPIVVGDAVLSKFEGGSVRNITATVSGTFVIDKSNGTGFILVADSIEGLRIERNPEQ